MLVYDLICSEGHSFEGWFADLAELEANIDGGLIQCPVCGDENICRRPSTFGLMKNGRREQRLPAVPGAAAKAWPEQLMEQFIKRWEDFSSTLEKEFVDVGSDFADEALKMHYGVSAPRNIRGQSTEDQDLLLKKEGVTVYKMPLLSRKNRPSSESN